MFFTIPILQMNKLRLRALVRRRITQLAGEPRPTLSHFRACLLNFYVAHTPLCLPCSLLPTCSPDEHLCIL